MARCYQCGVQTALYQDRSPLCDDCHEKATPRLKKLTLEELNANLNLARNNYRTAVEAQQQAFEFKHRVDGNPDGKLAIDNAAFQVELAATRFREALRDFVTALQMDGVEQYRGK
jgi:hypothetical protein